MCSFSLGDLLGLPPLGVDENLPIIRKNKLSTGIKDLDMVLEGGYPNPGNVLLLGPTCIEKTAISYHFASGGLKSRNEHVLFLTSDTTPVSIREKAASVDIELGGEITFIDCYSTTIGAPSKEQNVVGVAGPQSLEDLSFAISDIINKTAGKKLRVVFSSLSTLLLYNPRDSMLKFLQVVSGRLRNAGATTLFLVEEGVHDKPVLSMVEHIMDERYVITDKGGSFEFSAPGMGMSLPIKLGSNGIVIL